MSLNCNVKSANMVDLVRCIRSPRQLKERNFFCGVIWYYSESQTGRRKSHLELDVFTWCLHCQANSVPCCLKRFGLLIMTADHPVTRHLYLSSYIKYPYFYLALRSRVRSPALPDFLSSSGSGTGSTQPREPCKVN